MISNKIGTIAPPAVQNSKGYFLGLQEVLERLDLAAVEQISEAIWQAYLKGRTVYLFGNGGSAALASHIACDLAKGTVAGHRRRLRAVSLSDNIPMLTAWANDSTYDDIFSEQLRNLVEKDDLVLAISGSGNSRNVVRGLEAAREAGARTVALTGFDGGRVKELAELCLIVPAHNMQHVEDVHLSVTHAIFSSLRHRMLHADGE